MRYLKFLQSFMFFMAVGGVLVACDASDAPDAPDAPKKISKSPPLMICLSKDGCNCPSPNKISSYGSLPHNYVKKIKVGLENRLLDPESTRYKAFSVPRKIKLCNPLPLILRSFLRSYDKSHLVCADIKTKNRFGAYTGYQRYYFLISDISYNQMFILEANRLGAWRSSKFENGCEY